MKIFDKKDVFTCVNAEDADHYRLTSGYFADDLSELNEKVKKGNLEKLHHILQDIFSNRFFGNNRAFALFLPVDKVIEVKEKKYRPFKNVDEFMNHLDFKCLMNNYIKVENKITSERYEFMIVGCFNNGIVLPLYGALIMDQLFEKFNICIDGKYQPFGVLEE